MPESVRRRTPGSVGCLAGSLRRQSSGTTACSRAAPPCRRYLAPSSASPRISISPSCLLRSDGRSRPWIRRHRGREEKSSCTSWRMSAPRWRARCGWRSLRLQCRRCSVLRRIARSGWSIGLMRRGPRCCTSRIRRYRFPRHFVHVAAIGLQGLEAVGRGNPTERPGNCRLLLRPRGSEEDAFVLHGPRAAHRLGLARALARSGAVWAEISRDQ